MFQTEIQKIVRVLFIGNFLSRSSGSQSISELIADKLHEEGKIMVLKASHAKNRFLRLGHILSFSLFGSYSILHIDVFSGNSFLFATMAAFIGKLRRKKVILTLHGGALHEHYIGRAKSFKNLFQGSYVQTPSMFLKVFFEGHGFLTHYCANPIGLNKFPFQRDNVKIFSLLWVRAFTRIYNPSIPVEVLEKILKKYPLATLTMIGPDKGMMQETKQLITQLNLTNKINVLGPVNNDKLYEYYQSHAVYLNTTSYESFGVAVVEAASCGIPVVSFSVGEIPFLWKDNENILLAPHLDVDAMAHQVKRIFKHELLRNKLALNARKRAEDFSWENIKLHWLQLLSK